MVSIHHSSVDLLRVKESFVAFVLDEIVDQPLYVKSLRITDVPQYTIEQDFSKPVIINFVIAIIIVKYTYLPSNFG